MVLLLLRALDWACQRRHYLQFYAFPRSLRVDFNGVRDYIPSSLPLRSLLTTRMLLSLIDTIKDFLGLFQRCNIVVLPDVDEPRRKDTAFITFQMLRENVIRLLTQVTLLCYVICLKQAYSLIFYDRTFRGVCEGIRLLFTINCYDVRILKNSATIIFCLVSWQHLAGQESGWIIFGRVFFFRLKGFTVSLYSVISAYTFVKTA